jgi:pyruvate formate lyase activating enzyme
MIGTAEAQRTKGSEMPLTLYTAAGCSRCAILKNALQEKGLAFEEHDAVGEGRELFARFYRANRAQVRRGPEGIEFPVLVDGEAVRQGVAAAAAWLEAGSRLDGFFAPCDPVKGWVGGVEVSGGDPAAAEELARVLAFLKAAGLKLELCARGRNPELLEHLLDAGLCDRVVMEVAGPPERYAGSPGPGEVGRSMAVAARCPAHRFETTVAPYVAAGAGSEVPPAYPSPEEIAATARWLAEATGSPKQPYVLRRFDPAGCADERLRAVAELPPDALVRYRSAARRHQVFTEISTGG